MYRQRNFVIQLRLLGGRSTTFHRDKALRVTKCYTEPSNWTQPLEQTKQWKFEYEQDSSSPGLEAVGECCEQDNKYLGTLG
jgi:hypothetical protein